MREKADNKWKTREMWGASGTAGKRVATSQIKLEDMWVAIGRQAGDEREPKSGQT